MSDYLTKHVTRVVPQTEAVSELQVPNSAGGFSFAVTPEVRLERFLILGSEGGTYYIGEQDLTKQNVDNLKDLTLRHPIMVVNKAVEISETGRSYKNNAAIFVMAYVMTFGSDDAKSYARVNVNKVVRTSTHLFTFSKYLKALAPGTGLGTSRNRAIASWYETKSTEQIAYQAVKYRQREGWTHRDALRQSRPTGVNENLAKWILGKATVEESQDLPSVIRGFEFAQGAKSVDELLRVMDEFNNLPWEALPTQFLKDVRVWKKLFYNHQLTGQALVRNITRLARIGAFSDLVFAADYAYKLVDKEMIAKTKLHPINFLNALVVHTEGQADHRDNWGSYAPRDKDWVPSPLITDALDAGFHLAFANVVPSRKRTMIAVDVSGSMSGTMALGLDLTAAQVSGVMATTIAKTEPYYSIMGFSHEFKDLGITANMSLTQVMSKVHDNNFGRTDCSLPMQWSLKNKQEFDTFVVITDNETYAGRPHPHIALKDYRQKTGIDARLVVVGVAANNFSIADPTDTGMLDVCGCDANLPKLISEFSAGRI